MGEAWWATVKVTKSWDTTGSLTHTHKQESKYIVEIKISLKYKKRKKVSILVDPHSFLKMSQQTFYKARL